MKLFDVKSEISRDQKCFYCEANLYTIFIALQGHHWSFRCFDLELNVTTSTKSSKGESRILINVFFEISIRNFEITKLFFNSLIPELPSHPLYED